MASAADAMMTRAARLLPLLVALSALAAGPATITFRKVFRSSSPEFVEIRLDETGHGSYDIRQLDEAPDPQPFEVSPALTQKIFVLADRLHHFEGLQLDVHRRIANLGQKTFRWEKDGQAYQVQFNYTLNPTAIQLLQIFEGLSLQQEHQERLERAMRYDPLGLNDALLSLERDLDAHALPDPQTLLAVLDRIAAGSRYLDIARQRARLLAARIRAGR
jgi:hypothetical protein